MDTPSAPPSLSNIDKSVNNGKKKTFPFRLFEMIQHCHQNDPSVASWGNSTSSSSSSPYSFIIKDKYSLEKKYYRSKFESFTKQLNNYGFHNVTSKIIFEEEKKVEWIYFKHDSFLPDRADLLQYIRLPNKGDKGEDDDEKNGPHKKRKHSQSDTQQEIKTSQQSEITPLRNQIQKQADEISELKTTLKGMICAIGQHNSQYLETNLNGMICEIGQHQDSHSEMIESHGKDIQSLMETVLKQEKEISGLKDTIKISGLKDTSQKKDVPMKPVEDGDASFNVRVRVLSIRDFRKPPFYKDPKIKKYGMAVVVVALAVGLSVYWPYVTAEYEKQLSYIQQQLSHLLFL